MKNGIAVVVPIYNVEEYIVPFLESILEQETQPEEIILVNDSSSDNTLSVITEKYSSYKNVSIYTVPNAGAGSARNYGISKATSDYIFCADPDDLLCNDFFKEFDSALVSCPDMDLFCFNSDRFEDKNPQHVFPKIHHNLSGPQPSLKIFEDLLDQGSYTSAAWTYVLKREIISKHDLRFNGRVHEDHNYTLKAYLISSSAYVCNKTLYKQRVRVGSLTNIRKTDFYYESRFSAFSSCINVIDNSHIDSPSKSRIRKKYIIYSFISIINLYHENKKVVPEFIRIAIKIYGKQIEKTSLYERFLFGQPRLFAHVKYIKSVIRKLL